jgi:hypothetical protein
MSEVQRILSSARRDIVRAIVLRGSHHDLLAAEEQLGRSILYIPRMTIRERQSGRSRRTVVRVVHQWPGYCFLRDDGPSITAERLTSLILRHHLYHMVDDRITRVGVMDLVPSRDLEQLSHLRALEPDIEVPAPVIHAPGSRVRVDCGMWGFLEGTVVESNSVSVLLDFGQAASIWRGRADPARCVTVS